jgi:hypothetical protein
MSSSRKYWQVVMAQPADALSRALREAEDAGI